MEEIVEGAGGGGDGPGHFVVVVLRTPFLRSPAPRTDAVCRYRPGDFMERFEQHPSSSKPSALRTPPYLNSEST